MVVWVFNQYASTPYNSTGAGERHFFIAKELAALGIRTCIFASGYNHLFKRLPKFKGIRRLEDYFGFQFTWLKAPKYSPDSGLGRVFSWIWFPFMLLILNKKKYPKPDIIVVSSMSMFPMFPAYIYKIKYKAKIVFEIRDIWPLTLKSLGGYNPVVVPLIKFLELFEKWCYRKSNHIVSVLPYAIDHIQSRLHHFDAKNFSWIPNGIEPEYFLTGSTWQDLQSRIPNSFSGAKIVTYAGALGQANAMDSFINAILKLKDDTNFFFFLVGDGPLKLEYQNRLQFCKNVLFTGKVHKSEVLSILKNSNILYIGWYDLSIYRFGVSANKYNDYMLAEKPILTSSAIKGDMVDLAKCGIKVSPESTEAIIEGLNDFLRMDEEDIKTLGKNGKDYVLANNTYKVLSRQFENIYKSILK